MPGCPLKRLRSYFLRRPSGGPLFAFWVTPSESFEGIRALNIPALCVGNRVQSPAMLRQVRSRLFIPEYDNAVSDYASQAKGGSAGTQMVAVIDSNVCEQLHP